MSSEFSFASRRRALDRLRTESFDLLVIGGGITGVAVARDASSRGLRVALIEKGDFASGTSSASSKLVHGGLRYLENFEFKLVFESLSERVRLVRNQPNTVRWLRFFLPVYAGDPRGKNLVSIGLWLYDLLALFRAPHFHRRLSKKEMQAELPNLEEKGLRGGFTYYDASMWDDVICVENARAAADLGAAIATRVEAVAALWERGHSSREDRIAGVIARDSESGEEFTLRASRTVVCAGPHTDQAGAMLASEDRTGRFVDAKGEWKRWLKPSRGVHLVFDRERFPVPGALLLSSGSDGRVAFVIPREDFGSGVVIVGTTDGPSPENPEKVRVEAEDVDYLLGLLSRYFPSLRLGREDIISSYVGVRPLMDPAFGQEESKEASTGLSRVSREHHIGEGPGGTTLVAGGKYTTHRAMAVEIVDEVLKSWDSAYWKGLAPRVPRWNQPRTDAPVNPAVSPSKVRSFLEELEEARRQGLSEETCRAVESLVDRYGADAGEILELNARFPESGPSPEGFAYVESRFRYSIRREMALSLEDFYFRRIPLYLGRKDHGAPWIEPLSRVWASELGKSEEERQLEIQRFRRRIKERAEGLR